LEGENEEVMTATTENRKTDGSGKKGGGRPLKITNSIPRQE